MTAQERGFRNRLARAALGALALALVLFSIRTQRRVEHQAAFCTSSCHHSDPHAGSLSKAHAGVECQQCHTTTASTDVKLWFQSLIGSSSPTKHGAVAAKACTSCHEKNPADWRLVAATHGHREHEGAKNVDCLSCHAKEAHRSDPPEKVCTNCHAPDRLHQASTAGAETCLSCHSFTSSPKRVAAPTTVTCAKCHASAKAPMKDVNEHTLHGGVACQLCHNAHGKKPMVPVGQPVCARCHQFENFQTGMQPVKGPEEHRKCEGCHKPHAPLKSALEYCVNCHEKNAKGIVPASVATGKTTALKHKACTSCHLPHTWRAERSGCMQCHKDKAAMIQTRSPPQHATCTTCHEVHGPPPTGAVCVTCHAKTKGNHVALAPERHKDCTSCHDPHAPLPQDTRRSCAKCHTQQLTELSRDGPEGHAKESCFGCHQPHDNPLPPANICAKCHAERAKIVAAASPPKHRVCLSCHAPHKFKITEIAPVCAKCHGEMFPTPSMGMIVAKVPHQGDCKTCHTLHGSPGVPKTACFGCHAKVAAEFKPPNEKHAECRSCHQPHKPAALAVAACAGCHEQKALVATKWPSGSPHQNACNQCHQQHDVREKKACSTCHVKEATTAMGGKHQCVQCHAPHTAPPGFGVAWWTRCNECHAAKVTSVKLRGPTHSECKNCHQPHRFAIPTCTSCHTDIATKGLHNVAKHAATCNACHDPHVKSEPTREQCLSCHTNRRDHQPNAQKCQACHMFR